MPDFADLPKEIRAAMLRSVGMDVASTGSPFQSLVSEDRPNNGCVEEDEDREDF